MSLHDYVRVTNAPKRRWDIETEPGKPIAVCLDEVARDAAYRLVTGECEAGWQRVRALAPRPLTGAERDVRMADGWQRYVAGDVLTFDEFKAKHGDTGRATSAKGVEMATEAKSESVDESVQVDSSSVRVHGVWVGGVVDERYGERVAVALSKALAADRAAQKTLQSQQLAKIREMLGCGETGVFEAIEGLQKRAEVCETTLADMGRAPDPRVADLVERVAKLESSEHNHAERIEKLERVTPAVKETPPARRPKVGPCMLCMGAEQCARHCPSRGQ